MLLHCCCAPCAAYVLEYLSPSYDISVLFYNPNIHPRMEFDKRAAELNKLLALAQYPNSVAGIECGYDRAEYELAAAPLSDEQEGGIRCGVCFELRLEKTADRAKTGGYDYFATTLSVSPHKNAGLINEIGANLAEKYGVRYLASDFKKRDGYKRSVELSKKYGLYRQSYCGCAWPQNSTLRRNECQKT